MGQQLTDGLPHGGSGLVGEAKDEDSRVGAWGVRPDVAEALVEGNQEASLRLGRRGDFGVDIRAGPR